MVLVLSNMTGSYGFEQDLFELAVIFWDEYGYAISYNTEITNNVLGYLSNEEVMDTLRKIKNL